MAEKEMHSKREGERDREREREREKEKMIQTKKERKRTHRQCAGVGRTESTARARLQSLIGPKCARPCMHHLTVCGVGKTCRARVPT